MNNPVLLPKRKDFGFLKPPSIPSQSSIFLKRMALSRSNKNQLSTKSISGNNPAILHSNHHNSTPELSPDFNYMFDPLKLKYEIKNHLLGKSYAFCSGKNEYAARDLNVNRNVNNVGSNNALVSSFSKKKPPNVVDKKGKHSPNQLKSAHSERQAYTLELGTNFSNQSKQHHLLSIPFNKLNNSAIQLSDVAELPLDEIGFSSKRFLRNREKTSITSCTRCGKLYYDYKCLNCQFGKSKFGHKWMPAAKSYEYFQHKLAEFSGSNGFAPLTRSNTLNDVMLNQNNNRIAHISRKSTSKSTKPLLAPSVVVEKQNNFEPFERSFKFDLKSLAPNNEVNNLNASPAGIQNSHDEEPVFNRPAKLTLWLV